MTKTLSVFLMLLAAALFVACGDDHDGDHHDGDGHGHEEGHDDHDDHDHKDGDHDHDHDGDDHEGHDDHGHGKRVEVGTAKIGAYSVTLAVFGEVEAGHEAVLDIEVEGGAAASVRAWVGVSSGRGSLKAKIEAEGGEYHGHLEVPGKLPDGSQIWVEIESSDGSKAQGSFNIPK